MTGQGFNPPLEQAPWVLAGGFAYRPPTHPLPGHPTPGSPSTLRPHIALDNGEGILTFFPSTTLFSLALGPDLPSADEPSGGNLGFSGYRILTYIFVTQADILTSASSISASANTSIYNRTLPYRYTKYIAQLRQIT